MGRGLPFYEVTCLQRHPKGHWMAGTANNGIQVSETGVEWHPLANDLSGKGVYSLAFHPQQPEVVLCGTAPASLQLSLDGGKSFQELGALKRHPGSTHWGFPEPPYRSRLSRLFLHPRDPNVLLVGIHSGGVYLSGDVGHSWQERSKGLGRVVHDLQLHPEAPGRLYGCSPIGFFLSEDLGEQWQERNAGLAYLNSGCLGVLPSDPDVVFLTSHQTSRGGGTVYRSQNAGQRWEACAGLPFGSDLRYTALALHSQSILVGSSGGEVFWSGNLGTTWEKIRSNLPPVTTLRFLT